jgi:translocation and assembly module TamB
MRSWWKWCAGVAAVFAVLIVALFALVNTGPGQNFAASLVSPLTGGKVSVKGLSGRFPSALRAQEIVIADDRGPWLVIEDVAVDGSVLSLVRNHVDFARVAAARTHVLRLPISSNDNTPSPRIDIGMLDVPDLETSAELSSVPMHFSARGSLHIQSVRDLAADLALMRLDGSGAYRANGSVAGGIAHGTLDIDEAANGFITGFLRLNDIGPIKSHIIGEGPAEANTVSFVVDAGALHASGRGTANLPQENLDLDFSLSAPAMDIRQDLSWESLSAEGHAHGGFRTLALDMRLALAGLKTNGVSAARVTGTASGTTGAADFTAEASGLEISGLDPKFFAAAPLAFRAHADLRAPNRPLSFTLAHPTLSATGTATLDGGTGVNADVTLPDLKPYGALAGMDLAGRATFAARVSVSDMTAHIALDGSIAAAGGDPTVSALIGRNAPFSFVADVNQSNIRNLRARLKGPKVEADVTGALAGSVLDLALAATLSDASLFAPDLKGEASARATAKGPFRTAKLDAIVQGKIGTSDLAPQQVSLNLQSTGLPKPATGTFRGESEYRNAPLTLSGTFGWSERGLRLAVERGQWKSVSASGDIVIPQGAPFTGRAAFKVAQLGDLEPLIGAPVGGSADGTLQLQRQRGQAVLSIEATGHDLRAQDAMVATLTVRGDVIDPRVTPRLALKLSGAGASAARFSGNTSADVAGPLDGLTVKASGDLKDSGGRPMKVDTSAVLRLKDKEVALNTLALDYVDIKASLVRPATIRFQDGIAVDRLDFKSGNAELALSGRLTPTLAADLTLDNVSAQALRPYLPNLSQGILTGKAQLTGSLEAPRGAVSLQGSGLRLLGLPASVAPGTLDGRADLNGQTVQIDASLAFGPSKLAITGRAPIVPNETFNLHAAGTTDLSVLNAEVSAEGRRAIGQAALDATVSGTRDSPSIGGTVKLTNAEFQDYPRGLRITQIAADAEFNGKTLEITTFTGRAGSGTITGKGTVDIFGAGAPVNLTITARNAEPIATDTFHANLDADLTVTGSAMSRLLVAGRITVRRGESILANKLPPALTTINVVRPGETPPPPASATESEVIALDLTVSSPGLFFVRGRGLDAEMQGTAHVGGTVSSPNVSGGFEMRRGSFDLGAATLNFTTGKVTFEGESLRNRLDPALDFVAESMSGGYTARLEITGTVSNPKVQLTSTPALPQDEILAQLLFQQNVKQLTAFQLAAMGQAAATLGGFGTGLNPLASIRQTLGLDRLSVVTGANSQTELEAGKYVTRNVYVGAKQGLSSTPKAEVQVDLTKNLKAKATVATGNNATVTQGAQQQDQGSSVGLSWQFEY